MLAHNINSIDPLRIPHRQSSGATGARHPVSDGSVWEAEERFPARTRPSGPTRGSQPAHRLTRYSLKFNRATWANRRPASTRLRPALFATEEPYLSFHGCPPRVGELAAAWTGHADERCTFQCCDPAPLPPQAPTDRRCGLHNGETRICQLGAHLRRGYERVGGDSTPARAARGAGSACCSALLAARRTHKASKRRWTSQPLFNPILSLVLSPAPHEESFVHPCPVSLSRSAHGTGGGRPAAGDPTPARGQRVAISSRHSGRSCLPVL